MILTQRQLERMGLDEEPAKKRARVRFGARRFSTDTEYAALEKKTEHAPKGPSAADLIEQARRREHAAERERERSGGR